MIIFYSANLLVFFMVASNIQANSLYEDDKFSRGDSEFKSYPVKRSYDQPFYIIPHENQQMEEYAQNYGQLNQRYHHVDEPSMNSLQTVHEYPNAQSTLRRDERHTAKLLHKRNSDSQSKEPYGLVYSKGRLFGILEPYPELYELSPLSNTREGIEEIQPLPLQSIGDVRSSVSRLVEPSEDSEKDEEGQNEYARYFDDKYPMVLTNFKIDRKLNAFNPSKREKLAAPINEKKSKHTLNIKNEPISDSFSVQNAKWSGKKSGITNQQIAELSAAINRIKESDSSDKVEAIEEDLRGILNDMGLIETNTLKSNRDSVDQSEIIKRDVSNEDENLDEGENKIQIVKATHDPEKNQRMKRAEVSAADAVVSIKASPQTEVNMKSTVTNSFNGDGNIENNKDLATVQFHNYQSEGEAYIRNKRQEGTTENTDIMKGLQKSGELTVSGNKSPLASSENNGRSSEKRMSTSPSTFVTSDDYEKQLEQNIQERINAIKEEVKREIANLQAKNALATKKGEDVQRKKRDTVSTLLEEEPKILNPLEYTEEPLIPHVRTKRNLNVTKILKRSKRDTFGPLDDEYIFDDDEDRPSIDNEDLESIEDGEEDYSFDIEKSELPVNILNRNIDYSAENYTTVSDNTVKNSSSMFKSSTEEPITRRETAQTDTIIISLQQVSETNQTAAATTSTSVSSVTTSAMPQTQKSTVSTQMPSFQTDSSIPEDFKIKRLRRRRQINIHQRQPNFIHTRKKRAEALVPDGNSAYLPYRNEDDVDEEGDEFEDDGFDDRTASIHKRETNDDSSNRRSIDYQNILEYDVPNSYGINEYPRRRPVRRYITNLDSDVYDLAPPFMYNPNTYIRRKRNNYDQFAQFHSGGPMIHHLAAVRERNMKQLESVTRKKRNFNKQNSKSTSNNEEQRNIADLSDTDLFGALPQSYEGELSRFKRVKRRVYPNKEKK